MPPSRLRGLTIVALCFLVTVICALDRAAMSVAIIPMSAQYAYADSTKGVIASAYFWGYTLSNLATGVACARVSPKLILSVGVVLWSAFTVLTPAAAGISLPCLLACRALMGAAEGACLPTIQQLLANWVPVAERSRALALVTSGITVGTVGALLVAPGLVVALGWPSVFIVFGALGLLWCAAWITSSADAPAEGAEECVPYACELSWETAGDLAQSWSAVPWQRLRGSGAFRGVVVCGMAHNIGQLLLLSWLPTYFAQCFGLGIGEASMLAAPPWVACFALGNAAGWAADALTTRGAALPDVRRGFQLAGSLGPASCLLALAAGVGDSAPVAELLFTAALGLSACSYVGFNAAPQDMAKRTASAVYGLLNAAGCLAGGLAVWLAGFALEAAPAGGQASESFAPIFLAAAGAYAVGAAAFFVSYRGEREFD